MPAASQRLHDIAARLRAEGQVGLQREMAATIRAGAQPLVAEVRGAAYVSLPKRGGLNEEQGNQKITVSVLTGPRTAGVRLRTRTPGSMQTDQGYVRHPTPSGKWVQQEIPLARGWWSDTLARGSRRLTPALVATMNRVARRIQGGYR